MILLVDNYDSFVFNLARYFQLLGQQVKVVRNDAIDVDEVQRLQPSALVFSPGPCGPQEAGNSLQLVRACWREFPMLGVCLGHQTIAAAFGADIIRAPQPMHGRASFIQHGGEGVFERIASPLQVGRYHSLVVDEETLPDELRATAFADSGVVMAIQHQEMPVVGVQFHPESVLTESGHQLLANFLRIAGIEVAGRVPTIEDELQQPIESSPIPDVPITF